MSVYGTPLVAAGGEVVDDILGNLNNLKGKRVGKLVLGDLGHAFVTDALRDNDRLSTASPFSKPPPFSQELPAPRPLFVG